MATQDSKDTREEQTIAQDIFALANHMELESKEAQAILSDDLADLPKEFDEAFFEERRKMLLEYLSLSEENMAADVHPLVSVTTKGIFVLVENLQRLRDMFDPRAAAMGYRAAVAHAVPPPQPTVWLPMSCEAKTKPKALGSEASAATVIRLKFMKEEIGPPSDKPDVTVRVDGVNETAEILNYRAEFREVNVVLDREINAEAFEVISSEIGDQLSLEVVTGGKGQQ